MRGCPEFRLPLQSNEIGRVVRDPARESSVGGAVVEEAF
jgi:hypothetical protein